MEWLAVPLFALAVSADGLIAGLAYGVKKIRIPLLPLLLIALSSALAVTISMYCGRGLSAVIPSDWAQKIGAVLLMIIGGYFLLGALRDHIGSLSDDEELLSFNVKPLGVIVQILKEPASADMDLSGEISIKEAVFLGLALAMDALGAGAGMAMAGFNILFTALCVGMLKFILIYSGMYLGGICPGNRLKGVSTLLSGCIFILIGLLEIM
ncbi:MAG: sporulation membrane protein YtaF [Syntrophomonadaceae bacterium]|nr:sporulation membrane protein YtaF [Syntrophomonadaceae bacterium]